MDSTQLKVAIGQISPVWLNKQQTTLKIIETIESASGHGCKLIAFSEGLLPGYPFWLEHNNASRFNNSQLKQWHAHYLNEAVSIERGDLDSIKTACKTGNIACYLGIIERPDERGNHSCYASLVYIDNQGALGSVQRKLMPTYEERLIWSIGDGNGLRTHDLGAFKVGGLNCWENWMPLARASLYAQGENVHIASWPGSVRNTEDITRFMAMESRSYVISASSILRKESIPDDLPMVEDMVSEMPDTLANGGSCIAAPSGEWLVAPVADIEDVITTTLDLSTILGERQNFDPSGHYSRADVFRLEVDRTRQKIAHFSD